MLPLIVFIGLGLGLFFWAETSHAAVSGRTMTLINGKRYAIVHRIQGAGWDASMYPGFCNFSDPVITATSVRLGTEVQFTADWCQANMQWDVPANIAITEV